MELQWKKQCLILLTVLIGLLGLSASVAIGCVEAAELVRTNNIHQNKETTVTITNLLIDESDFTVHCKSGDDDLGAHVVSIGQSYEFKFRPNFVGTTLFFCGFTSNFGSVVFDIYKKERDWGNRCPTKCIWAVAENGVLGFRQSDVEQDLIFPWKK